MKNGYDCIILAAGVSARMGIWKLTMPFMDSTIVEHSVNNALKACSRVIIVGGYRFGELKNLFSGYKDVMVVENKLYKRGMFSSVKAAVPFVETERFFISLGDMPMIAPEVYSYLNNFTEIDVVIPQYRGKKGHPLFLSSKVVKRILQFSDESTMRDVLQEFYNLLIPVGNEYILHDIDTAEEYKTFLEKIGHSTDIE